MFRFRTVLATAAVAVAAALAFATPASAHDVLVESSPAADEQLTVVPEEVVLTFSNNLLSLDANSGTAITVVDEQGEDWIAGDPVVSADTVTAPLQADMPNGSYDVTWKVVSSDGHPTSGEYSFTLAADEAAESPAPTESVEPTESAEPSAAPVAPVATETPAAEAPDAAPWPVLIGLGVVLVIAVVLVVVMAMRKKR